FFYLYCDHRSLHSFPTRRSSDLIQSSGRISRSSGGTSRSASGWFNSSGRVSQSGGKEFSGVAGDRGLVEKNFNRLAGCRLKFFRSEEHTSELQSRSDLVCRLLLE